MTENTSGNTNASSLCSNHELLLTKRKDLSADHTGNAWPSYDTKDRTKSINTDTWIDLVVIHNGTDDNVQRHCRDTDYNINHTHENGIYPSSEVTGDTADENTDDTLDNNNNETDHQGDTSAVHQSGQHIHTVSVCSSPVLLAWGRISVIDSGLFLITDYILCILCLKLIGLFPTVLIQSCECGSLLCDCLFYRFLKGKGKEHAICLRGN